MICLFEAIETLGNHFELQKMMTIPSTGDTIQILEAFDTWPKLKSQKLPSKEKANHVDTPSTIKTERGNELLTITQSVNPPITKNVEIFTNFIEIGRTPLPTYLYDSKKTDVATLVFGMERTFPTVSCDETDASRARPVETVSNKDTSLDLKITGLNTIKRDIKTLNPGPDDRLLGKSKASERPISATGMQKIDLETENTSLTKAREKQEQATGQTIIMSDATKSRKGIIKKDAVQDIPKQDAALNKKLKKVKTKNFWKKDNAIEKSEVTGVKNNSVHIREKNIPSTEEKRDTFNTVRTNEPVSLETSKYKDASGAIEERDDSCSIKGRNTVKLKEHNTVSMKLEVSKEPDAISKKLDLSMEPDTTSKKLEVPKEPDATIAKLEVSTESDAISKKLEVSTESNAISKKLEISKEPDTIGKKLEVSKEPDANIKKLEVSTESDAISKKVEVSKESATISNKLELSVEPDTISKTLEVLNDSDTIGMKLEVSKEPDTISKKESKEAATISKKLEVSKEPDTISKMLKVSNEPDTISRKLELSNELDNITTKKEKDILSTTGKNTPLKTAVGEKEDTPNKIKEKATFSPIGGHTPLIMEVSKEKAPSKKVVENNDPTINVNTPIEVNTLPKLKVTKEGDIVNMVEENETQSKSGVTNQLSREVTNSKDTLNEISVTTPISINGQLNMERTKVEDTDSQTGEESLLLIETVSVENLSTYDAVENLQPTSDNPELLPTNDNPEPPKTVSFPTVSAETNLSKESKDTEKLLIITERSKRRKYRLRKHFNRLIGKDNGLGNEQLEKNLKSRPKLMDADTYLLLAGNWLNASGRPACKSPQPSHASSLPSTPEEVQDCSVKICLTDIRYLDDLYGSLPTLTWDEEEEGTSNLKTL